MNKEKYLEEIKNFSDYMLYKSIKQYLKEEQSGIYYNSKKLSQLFKESKIRKEDIFKQALEDSLYEFNRNQFPNIETAIDSTNEGIGNVVLSDHKRIFEEYEISDEKLFLSKVKGNSMIGAKIDDGDTLAAERSDNVKDGDIIIAEIDGRVFVKRYKETTDGRWLISENVAIEDVLITDEMNFQILGKVIACVKKF